MSTSTANPSVEDVEEYDTDTLITYLQNQRFLNLSEQHIKVLRENEVAGYDFLELKQEVLERYGLKPGPANRIAKFVDQLNSQKQSGTTDKKLIEELLFRLFLAEFANSKNSSSIYRFVVEHGEFGIWDFEMDIEPIVWIGQEVFNENRNAPGRGLSEIKDTQPFCYKVLSEINYNVFLFEPEKKKLVVVVGDYGQKLADKIYADIIIGHEKHYSEFKKSPPNLSKGLGWEVKNDITGGSKSHEAKGQLLKYAREYLTAEQPLTSAFYGCLTDGKSWQFVKIQIILVNENNIKVRKVKFEESGTYEWNENTASLIAGLLKKYYDDLLTSNNIVHM